MKYTFCFLLILFFFNLNAQRSYSVISPSGEISVSVTVGDSVYYSVNLIKEPLVTPSSIAMLSTGTKTFGIRSTVSKSTQRSVNETIINPVPFKRKNIPDHFNELTLHFRENFSLIFRAYDDGVAYRFTTALPDSLIVANEIATIQFPGNPKVYFPQVQKRDNVDIYHTSFEEPYRIVRIDSIRSNEIAFSPVLVDLGKVKTVLTESDLIDYPGMFLRGSGRPAFKGDFAAYPDREEIMGGEFKQPVVAARKNYIAKTAGRRSFPWRIMIIAKKDADLLTNDLVYRLSTPAQSRDWSWVQPGIGTDEWIVGINLHSVDFKAGINTQTYKYYIDFAKRFGMQYVMLDAGWSDYNDLFKITPGLDLEELAAYARYKNIGLMLWTLSMTLERQLEPALERFEKLGIKMIMTDFMDRDDQKMLRFYTRVAEATARHKIMIMYHGAFKNAGFERTWPHAITREAVLGSEYNIWSDKASPEHDVLIPFIRMVSGPMDYEPGFTSNANKHTFRPLPDQVMSQGTRTHQLAMFVAYDSPLQIFSGNPSDAWTEIAYTTYLSSLPTSWDDTVVPDARLGDYLIVARKKDNDWYIAALNDWTPRTIEIDLNFLGDGQYNGFTCEDGPNAAKNAKDYRMGFQRVKKGDKIKIQLAAGGGFVAKLIKI
jgi:alpha-glucosidase